MPQNTQNRNKIDQMSIKYTNVFHCKTLQTWILWFENMHTIWQPWLRNEVWQKTLSTMQPGWPDEFVTKSPKMWPNPFLLKLIYNFYRG
jgi:hypothetical protein